MPSNSPQTSFRFDSLIGPLALLLDRVIPDKTEADRAKLALLEVTDGTAVAELQTNLSAIIAEAGSRDPWTSRARPSFLYVMYVMILWSLPMGLVAAFRPDITRAIAMGINAYLNAIPQPLYGLFGTGYLGYTAARQWGKIAGSDK